jgi:hypothetical protein
MASKLLAPDKFLTDGEIFWRDHQKWLQDSGYKLRPRYMPDWTPPWKGTNKPLFKFEESIWLLVRNVTLTSIMLSILTEAETAQPAYGRHSHIGQQGSGPQEGFKIETSIRSRNCPIFLL